METEYKYGQYCTPLTQSDCIHFFLLAIRNNMGIKMGRTAKHAFHISIHVRVRIRGLEMLVFRKTLPTYLMDDHSIVNHYQNY